jgi:outer membrane protein assembly factor BamB
MADAEIGAAQAAEPSAGLSRRRLLGLAAGAAAAAAAGAGAGLGAARWDNRRRAAMAWTTALGSTVNGAPAVASGMVYVSCETGIFALRAGTGQRAWQAGVPRSSSVAVAGDAVCVSAGSSAWEVQAVRASDGRALWRVPGAVLASGPGDLILVSAEPAGGGPISAVRAGNGRTVWRFPGSLAAGPVRGMVFGASGDNQENSTIYALRASDGARLWHFTGSGAPLVFAVGATVFVVSGTTRQVLHALRARDGAQRWQAAIPAAATAGSLAAAAGLVYVGLASVSGPAGGLAALRARDGRPAWRGSVLGPDAPALAAGAGAVYVADGNLDYGSGFGRGGRVSALRAEDGRRRWSVPIGDVSPGPVLAGEVVIAGGPASGDSLGQASAGRMYALRASDGAPAWELPVIGSGQSAPVLTVSGGIAYIGDTAGRVTAMRT